MRDRVTELLQIHIIWPLVIILKSLLSREEIDEIGDENTDELNNEDDVVE
jgi:hypothetical protein